MFVFIGKLYSCKQRINFKHFFSLAVSLLRNSAALPFIFSFKQFYSHLFCVKPQL